MADLTGPQMREIAYDTIAYLRAIHSKDNAGAAAVYDAQPDPEALTLSCATLLVGLIRTAEQAAAEQGITRDPWAELRARADALGR